MIASSVEEVRALYERWGRSHYDESLSQLAHALQTAALAEQSLASDELIVAALCHDVGHLLDLQAVASAPGVEVDLRHESLGARYLSGLFPAGVTEPIALHVSAKRYLCATDPGYHDALSDGSKRSLERQGGPMSQTQALSFERNRRFEDAVRLREWDDAGKVEGLVVESFEHYLPLLERVAAG